MLDEGRLNTIREGCAKVVKAVVATDPQRAGNRGSHRYGFDGAAGHFDCLQHWACLIDPPVLNSVLTAILGEGCESQSPLFGNFPSFPVISRPFSGTFFWLIFGLIFDGILAQIHCRL